MAFSTFTELCHHPLCLVSKHFHPHRRYLFHLRIAHVPLSPKPLGAPVCLLPLEIHLLWVFHIHGFTQEMTFCVWILSLSVMLSRFIRRGSTHQCFLPFYGSVILHCAERSPPWKRVQRLLRELNKELLCDSATLLLGGDPEELKTGIQANPCA